MTKGPEHGRLPLNIRNHFFTAQVTKRWQKVPREVVRSPSLETSKRHMDVVVDNGLRVVLLEQGVGPRGPFQPPPSL